MTKPEDGNIGTDGRHSVYTTALSPGVALTCVKSGKFKTGCISVNLITGLSNAAAAKNALLTRVLRRGTAKLPDLQHLSSALDELYGARIEPINRKKGELHCIGLYADFPDARFIPGGGDILDNTISLLGDVLFSPDMRGSLLREDYVESEKTNLIDDIRAAINDKRGYAISRLVENMCAGEAYSVRRLGSEESMQQVTPAALTAHYRGALETARIEILYCGAAEPGHIEQLIAGALSGLPREARRTAPDTQILLYPPSSPPRRFEDTFDVAQGKLAIGFRLGAAMSGTPDYPALMVFNSIFGSGETSKLFMSVRERLSLCYYIGSMIDKSKGVMIVSSGVDCANFDAAADEIHKQLRAVKNGEIDDWELTSAKRSVASSFRQAMDRPGGLEDLYFDSAVSAHPYDPYQICLDIGNVTLDRVVRAADDIQTDSIYYLSGYLGGEGGDGDD